MKSRFRTQVDVLVLYTAEAKMALGNVSDAQIESDIATAFQWSNDATENSEIPLTFNIAHTQQVRRDGVHGEQVHYT